tara:strand:- start:3234 stop:4328 length:1095 start_codon:yes stop_codon:yes gene_type:complete
MKFVDLDAQRQRIRRGVDDAIAKVLNHGRYILGPEVLELEAALAKFSGASNCVSVANGTDALQIVQMFLGISAGDEVIVPGFTYVATAETVLGLGATPIYVDVSDTDYNLCAEKLVESISPRTKAIIPVSMFGQCADFSGINEIAERFNVPVIEDAAQSFGARQSGLRSTNLSKFACTSFFPSKPLGCYGDGGAIFAQDENDAAIIRQIARHGQDRRYHHIRLGVNSRLDTLQAAIVLQKLQILDKEIEERQMVAEKYNAYFSECPDVKIPIVQNSNTSAWAQYSIRVPNRGRVIDVLDSKEIPYAIHYPMPVYKQPAMQVADLHLDVCESVSKSIISLPMHPYLSDEEILTVSTCVMDAVNSG